MYEKIKNKVDKKLRKFINNIDKTYSLNKISPLLFKSIKDFILRDGKRIRPILFITGYLGFANKVAAELYTTALSIELLHDFMLVHDDIIDKSEKRRGKASMHKMLNNHLAQYKKIKFDGIDLAIITGDVMYAIAIKAFLSIKENMNRKEKALKNFIEAAIYTGSGEFIELTDGIRHIKNITKENIYRIYDYKTARYTFSAPLVTGAILAGADKNETDKLYKFGIYLGRAFQIKDDILGIFGKEKKIGKSILSDLQEAKKTLLIWYAYNNSKKNERKIVERIFNKSKVGRKDLANIRRIIEESGALNYAKDEINRLMFKAQLLINSCHIKKKSKTFLVNYTKEIIN
ncbi:MAG: polyprenyl synthetase family protein [Candidatus Omnitrophica bacterium]|jgi:geranylgeranyl diphosphate synthase type I|nr:polyprenyl synthetase family protein [Candidatus Omnitrophota bacterium]